MDGRRGGVRALVSGATCPGAFPCAPPGGSMAPTKSSGGIMKRVFAALLVTLFGVPAHAADPIKVVVPFAAGGPVDALARIMAQELSSRLATDVVVENRGGAGGLLAVDQVARAPADGRTILFASVGAFVITNAPTLANKMVRPSAGARAT